eukprot:TRINITY_DN3476_c1_g1_i5.p1 TRINITY_DN3476_c1_g1~~TRINITY_DN3476_c1_g1_i5.p1  ORF type:complete len:633 (+),score=-74.28 TRINITY_DN3476_c1_g1_i5:181-2079(+)
MLEQFELNMAELVQKITVFTTFLKELNPTPIHCVEQLLLEGINNCIYCDSHLVTVNNKDGQLQCNKEELEDCVVDHCHLTGRTRGLAHRSCNSTAKECTEIPVYFHNGRGYDFHFVLEAFTSSQEKYKITPISNNTQKMMQITVESKCEYEDDDGKRSTARNMKMVFRDSMMMFNGSVERLFSNLEDEDRKLTNNYIITGILHKDVSTLTKEDYEIIKLISQKGLFPYTWFNDYKKLTQVGVKEFCEHMNGSYDELINKYGKSWAWYDILKDGYISRDDFERVKKVFAICNNDFFELHDMYLTVDVLALSDILVYNRKRMMEFYGLDFTRYVSTPSFAWDALLKMTKVRLPSLPDIDMYMFFETKYGGFTNAIKRYATTSTSQESHLLYIDANNLYGHAMSQELPYQGFKWIDCKTLKELNMNPDMKNFSQNINEVFFRNQTHKWSETKNDIKSTYERKYGARLEVTLHYPTHLHQKHYDYPLAPYNRIVDTSEYTEYQNELVEDPDLDINGGKCQKLISDFKDRRGVWDIRSLIQFQKEGLVIKEVHRGVVFETRAWMKQFIDFNTDQRSKATNNADKDLFKLMNNSVYGKTMENVRDRMNARIFHKTDEKKILKYQSKFNFTLNRLDIGE